MSCRPRTGDRGADQHGHLDQRQAKEGQADAGRGGDVANYIREV